MKKTLIFLLYFICIFLVILDVFCNKQDLHSNIEKFPLIFALIGFLATFFYVFISRAFRKIVLKDKDFYDKH